MTNNLNSFVASCTTVIYLNFSSFLKSWKKRNWREEEEFRLENSTPSLTSARIERKEKKKISQILIQINFVILVLFQACSTIAGGSCKMKRRKLSDSFTLSSNWNFLSCFLPSILRLLHLSAILHSSASLVFDGKFGFCGIRLGFTLGA